MTLRRAQACCAIGPEGLIDIDMIRRSTSSCHGAASNITGTPWPALVKKGWVVANVRIVAEDDVDGDVPALRMTIDHEPLKSAPAPRRMRTDAPGRIKLFRCEG